MERPDNPVSVCAACGHVTSAPTSYCGHCGAPRGVDDTGAWRVFGVPTPLMGRDAVLDELRAIVRDAVGARSPRLVALRGAEGVGKTRLLAALDLALADEPGELLVLRASPRGDGPYPSLVDVLRQRFYIAQGADTDAWRRGLTEGLAALLGPARAPEALAALGPLVGLEMGASRPNPLMIEPVLGELLARDAAQNPLVLIFDDVDRGDQDGARLVANAVARVPDSAVVMIAAASDPEAFAAIGCHPGRHDVREVDLRPLDDHAASQMVDHLLSRVATDRAGAVKFVVEHALGNPLVAEEIVRILISEGIVDTRGDAWSVDLHRLASVALPTDLEAVVRERLARLDEDERQLLSVAALIGETFWAGALHATRRGAAGAAGSVEALWDVESLASADGATRDDVRDMLGRLADRDVILHTETPELPGEDAWRFKHAIEQRILAEDVDDAVRRTAGAAVGRWLVVHDAGSDAIARMAAEQFAAAGEVSRAAEQYTRAGDGARTRHANAVAIACFERALALLPVRDVDLRIDVLHRLGSLYSLIGDFERSIPIFEEIARASWRVASRAKGGVAFNKLGRAYRSLGEYDRALRHFERALALFATTHDRAGIAATLDDMGRVAWIRGDYEQAESRYTHALALRREIGDPRSVALSLNHLGTLRIERGAFRDALNLFREAFALRRELGDLSGMADSLHTIGQVVLQRGDTDTAARLWSEALAAATDVGDRAMQGTLRARLGEAALASGDLDDAAAHLEESTRIGDAIGDRRVQCEAMRLRGELATRRGDRPHALDLLEGAAHLAAELGSPVLAGRVLLSKADATSGPLYDTSGTSTDESGADACYREAITIFEAHGNEAELGRAYHSYGTHLLEQGLLLQGKKHLAMASDIFERLEMRRILAHTTATIDAI